MNKKFYKKICLAFTFSILCFGNLAFSQGSERAEQSIRGIAPRNNAFDGQSNLRSDVKPASRPNSTKPVNNPKNVHSNPLSVPANDECTGAFPIGVAANEADCSPITVNTTSSTQSAPDPFCAGYSNDDDVWYKFIAPYKSITAKASNLGSGVFGVGFVLYSDSCNGMESLECTVWANNNRQDFLNLIPGHTYYLRTFTNGLGSGTFDLCLMVPPPPPANDECSGAIFLSTAINHGACSPITVNTISSTHSLPDPSCTSYSNDDDVWYKFVATDSTMIAEASNLGSTVYGVGFVLYEGSCAGVQSIECTTYAMNNRQSFQKLKIGTTYYLRTFTSGIGGTFDLCIYRTPPPANDECSNASPITANGSSCNSIQGDIEGAYQSLPPVNCNGYTSYVAIDVWYKFVAASTKQTILVAGSKSFDPVVEILDGCNGASLYCSDKNYGYGSIETIKDSTFIVGKTYYVRVYNNGSNPPTTSFDICIYKTPNPPVNDNCGGALKINPTANGNICTTTTVNTVSATHSTPDPTCASYDNDDDVWYYFTANDTTMTVKSMNYSAGILGVGYVLYADSCLGTQSIECNYNAPSGAQTFKKLIKGKTYFLRTFTYMANVTGTYDICVFAGLPISKNDECNTAIPIAVNNSCTPTKGDVLGATQSLPPINCGTGQASVANDIWYSFVADQDNATITVKGVPNFDAVAEMFDGCGGNSIGCSDIPGSGVSETISNSSITKGNTYYIRVYSYYGNFSSASAFDICVTSKLTVGISNSNAVGKSLNVFPNPAQNDLNIRFVSPSENSLSMKMYNAAGQVVYTFTSGQFSNEFNKQIPVEGLAKGFYLLQVVTETGVYNQKVLID